MSGSISTPPAAVPEFTGELFLPSCSGEIACEHWHRYAISGIGRPWRRLRQWRQ